MMRQTGGVAVGEISTRSSPFCLAIATACGGGMMPSCWPVSSITRISLTRIRSLTRTRSSRRGLLSKAITASCSMRNRTSRASGDLLGRIGPLRLDLVARPLAESGRAGRSEIAARPAPHGHRSFRHFAVAGDQHVGHLLQLRLPDLISNLFLTVVEIDPESGLPELVADRPGIVEM